MYELVTLSENCFYVESPAKIGIVKVGDNEVVLIDSGSDKDAGRKVRQILDREGWRLSAIFNTHSNADHIGGNKYLQDATGCKIYAPGIEQSFTRHPILEPAFLYGGFPPEELHHKFLLAKESDVLPLTEEVLPEGLEMIPLEGHFFSMVGFRTKEGIFFIADCLSSKATLEKYRVGFIYDVRAYLDTLKRVSEAEATLFVPSHAEPTEDIRPLAQLNARVVEEIAADIEALCATPKTSEALLKELFDKYGLMMNFQQYALVGSTLRSYLSFLKGEGRVKAEFKDNLLLWSKI